MTDFHNSTPDMQDGYYVILKRHDDKTIMVHSPPYQTTDQMDAAMAEAERWIDQSVFNEGGVFLDCYWIGPEDEPMPGQTEIDRTARVMAERQAEAQEAA